MLENNSCAASSWLGSPRSWLKGIAAVDFVFLCKRLSADLAYVDTIFGVRTCQAVIAPEKFREFLHEKPGSLLIHCPIGRKLSPVEESK